MKFTLSLSDYIDQYTTNKTHGDNTCPICYEQCLYLDTKPDLKHVIDCYKEDMLLNVIQQYRNQHGDTPKLSHDFIDIVLKRVADELFNYCETHQKTVQIDF
jgi:hypothetical protein